MQRQQHQHGSKQPRPPQSARSRQQLRMPKVMFNLGKPEWTIALVVLGSAWVVVLVIAAIAVSGLLSLNASDGNRVPRAAMIRETTETAQANRQPRLPLWLFGAIALSCAAGSMLVSKQINRPPRPRKSTKVKRLAPHAAIATTAPPSPIAQPQQYSATPSFVLNSRSMQHPSTTTTPFMAPATLMQLAHQESQSAVGQTDVSASIVPAEDKHPLDWGEANLADQLDIRKQRSVSSLL